MTAAAKIASRVRSLPLSRNGVAATGMLLSQLDALGWQQSLKHQSAVDSAGQPVPWWTYAANNWLARALKPSHRVFEFGSGNSTLWLAARVGEVHSVEHDHGWATTVRQTLPGHVRYHLVQSAGSENDAPLDAEYLRPLRDTEGAFDLVIVDGQARNTCAEIAAERVGDDGLILLDDADRMAYRPTHDHLSRLGFGRLDFFSPKPGVGYLSTTSLFCRDLRPWMRVGPPEPSGY